MDAIFRFLLRLIVLAAGLLFFCFLMLLALGLLAVWLLRALWARLTGRPVTAWQFDYKRYASRYPFKGAGQRGNGEVVDVDVIDLEAHTPPADVPAAIQSDPKR